MKVGVVDALGWEPERGALSAEDGLGALSRFSRTCAAVVERCWDPAASRVIVGTATGASVPAATVLEELGGRWPKATVELVVGGAQTLPTCLIEAAFALEHADAVVCVVTELQPGAELCSVFRLAKTASMVLELAHRPGRRGESASSHLNPCAGALALADGIGGGGVSVRVASWSIALAVNG